MAAPEYVPTTVAEQPRVYQSPPRRHGSWTNDRPGDFNGRQPVGPGLGSPGPDQGYALKLARQFEGQLALAAGEHEADAIEGCLTVALKRASLFGRAPTVHDLTVAFAVWGYLGEGDDELIAVRRQLFEEVSHSHHYMGRRAIADAVPDVVLRMTPAQVRLQAAADWRSLVDLPGHDRPAIDADALEVVPMVEPPAPIEIDDVAVIPAAADELLLEEVGLEPTPENLPPPPPLPTRQVEDEPVDGRPLIPEGPPVAETPAPPPPPAPAIEVTEPEPVAAAPTVATPLPPPPPAPEPVVEDKPAPAPAAPEPAVAAEPLPPARKPKVEENPARRKPVKPVPLDPNEVAALARKAKVAFQKQQHNVQESMDDPVDKPGDKPDAG